MAKNKKWELNRKQYMMIRKMDHNEMQEYLNAVYENGVKRGMAAGTFNAPLALEAIAEIKGIGKTKLEQVKLALMAAGAKFPEEPAAE